MRKENSGKFDGIIPNSVCGANRFQQRPVCRVKGGDGEIRLRDTRVKHICGFSKNPIVIKNSKTLETWLNVVRVWNEGLWGEHVIDSCYYTPSLISDFFHTFTLPMSAGASSSGLPSDDFNDVEDFNWVCVFNLCSPRFLLQFCCFITWDPWEWKRERWVWIKN